MSSKRRITKAHLFGGNWTEDKLLRLQKYLSAYMTIFSNNPKAQYFTPIYIDAFAGTGYRTIKQENHDEALFPEFAETETTQFLKGSARIALEIKPSFGRYIFIEQDPEYMEELKSLKKEFAPIAERIELLQGEANKHLKKLCEQTDWHRNRAVFFLDPYGMEVEWTTIEAIARTKAADLWLLFPLGVAVTRLLKRRHPPTGAWADRLTKMFGSDEWKTVFYPTRTHPSLFGDVEIQIRDANWTQIGNYFVAKLKSVFARVAPNPLVLKNSKNSPLFLLCFAASNPKGSSTAVKIAQNILGR
ncbi:MAG: three-Cys-motif partner protein TcmP [Calditrichia bacterium]